MTNAMRNIARFRRDTRMLILNDDTALIKIGQNLTDALQRHFLHIFRFSIKMPDRLHRKTIPRPIKHTPKPLPNSFFFVRKLHPRQTPKCKNITNSVPAGKHKHIRLTRNNRIRPLAPKLRTRPSASMAVPELCLKRSPVLPDARNKHALTHIIACVLRFKINALCHFVFLHGEFSTMVSTD